MLQKKQKPTYKGYNSVFFETMFAKIVKSTVIWVNSVRNKGIFMESNVVFLSEARNAMSQALWKKQPIKYPLWYKLLTRPGQVVRSTNKELRLNDYFSENLQIIQTEIKKFLDDFLLPLRFWSDHSMDTLLPHEATGEELRMTVKWQKWCWSVTWQCHVADIVHPKRQDWIWIRLK